MKSVLLIGGPFNGQRIMAENDCHHYEIADLREPPPLMLDQSIFNIEYTRTAYREIHPDPCIFKFVEA